MGLEVPFGRLGDRWVLGGEWQMVNQLVVFDSWGGVEMLVEIEMLVWTNHTCMSSQQARIASHWPMRMLQISLHPVWTPKK